MNKVYLIAAADLDNGIGLNGDLPWKKIPEDMSFFMRMTKGNTVVMGRKTWESIGSRPLKNRTNVIITKDPNFKTPFPEVQIINNPNMVYNLRGLVFIIGGAQIYEHFIKGCDGIFLTVVEDRFKSDTKFPKIDTNIGFRSMTLNRVQSSTGYDLTFNFYQRRCDDDFDFEMNFPDFEFYYLNRY